MAVRSVSSLGWIRWGDPSREATDNQDLAAERKKDSRVTRGVRVAKDRLRFKVMLIETRRFLGLGRVDVDVIE